MDVTFSIVDASSPQARWALTQYFDELAERFPSGFDPGDGVETAAVDFNPPRGLFVIAERDGNTIGCGALHYHDAVTAEIKRMWVNPSSRGIGLGKRLLTQLEDRAAQAGRTRIVLDTNTTLTEAIGLYRTFGYMPTDRYNDNPYAEEWFEKALSPSIDFYFDPACPWTWIASRWVAEVAAARGLDVRWRTFSLKLKNAGVTLSPELDAKLTALFRALRVIEAARAEHGEAAVGDLYREFGARIHHDGDVALVGLTDAITTVGLPASLAAAADDATWDKAIAESTDAARALVGDDVGVPIISLGGDRPVFFGPVMSPAPTGQAALDLWDAYVTITRCQGLYEIKRSRHVGPIFGARPTTP
ncbi:MAG: GNAT family N-acetyltransferase [Acidimicrobiia bacterium]